MNTPEIIEALATRRAGGTASLFLSWSQALAMLPPLPDPQLRRIAGALPSPGTARHLARFLAREADPQTAVTTFLADVDESTESLEDWLAGFGVFADYLMRTALRPGLCQAAGFLHCCVALIESGPRYASFPQTVETMLSTYGYEGSTEGAPA